jgi:hypothetical protein
MFRLVEAGHNCFDVYLLASRAFYVSGHAFNFWLVVGLRRGHQPEQYYYRSHKQTIENTSTNTNRRTGDHPTHRQSYKVRCCLRTFVGMLDDDEVMLREAE